MGVPIAIRLIALQDPLYKVVGVSVLIALIAIGKLLLAHYKNLRRVVSTRISERHERSRAEKAESDAKKLSETDFLTGAANRRALFPYLDKAILNIGKTHNCVVIATIDLDGFKPINDTYGHAAGDQVLVAVSARLRNEIAGSPFVARMGGDEFALVWKQKDIFNPQLVVGELEELIAQPIDWSEKELTVKASCGVSIITDNATPAKVALANADQALYKAKDAPTMSWCIFDDEMRAESTRANLIERELSKGDFEEELRLATQAIWSCSREKVVAREAHLRWNSPNAGEVRAKELFEIGEKLELSSVFQKRVVELAAALPLEIPLTLNFDGKQLSKRSAGSQLLRAFSENRLDPRHVAIEVAHDTILPDLELFKAEMAKLRSHGYKVALDRFGANDISLDVLREMSFDIIKFDGRWTSNIVTSELDRKLLHGMVSFCRAIQVDCVATNVESQAQFELLKSIGVEKFQGYLIDLQFETPGGRASRNTVLHDPTAYAS
nr:EAL domain-containing protein [Sphingomicrobium astaxanthinifaciens]